MNLDEVMFNSIETVFKKEYSNYLNEKIFESTKNASYLEPDAVKIVSYLVEKPILETLVYFANKDSKNGKTLFYAGSSFLKNNDYSKIHELFTLYEKGIESEKINLLIKKVDEKLKKDSSLDFIYSDRIFLDIVGEFFSYLCKHKLGFVPFDTFFF